MNIIEEFKVMHATLSVPPYVSDEIAEKYAGLDQDVTFLETKWREGEMTDAQCLYELNRIRREAEGKHD